MRIRTTTVLTMALFMISAACNTHRSDQRNARWLSQKYAGFAGAVYDRTQSYAAVLTGMIISLLIAATLTALLIKPWADIRKR